MSLIDLPTARAHLRVEDDYPEEQVALYLAAAEQTAAEFLNRRVFVDDSALGAAVGAVPAALTSASAAHTAAIDAAPLIEDCAVRDEALRHAARAFVAARTAARETYDGIVVNDAIKAAILLMLGHLFENRQDNVTGTIVSELPLSARSLLMPFRVGWGV